MLSRGEKFRASIPDTVVTTLQSDLFADGQIVEKKRLDLLTSEEPITQEILVAELARRGLNGDRFTTDVHVRPRDSVFYQKASAEHRLGEWITIARRRRIFGWQAVQSMSLSVLLEEAEQIDSRR